MKAAGPAALFFLAAALAFAQSTGTLTGTVTDPWGAVVPNAEVTCRNVNTGVSQSAKSNAEGLFRFPDLPIGIYELAVTQPGFERLVRSGVEMITGRTVDIPLQLKAGESTQSVEVAAVAPVIQTTSSEVQTSFSSKNTAELPLNGRNTTHQHRHAGQPAAKHRRDHERFATGVHRQIGQLRRFGNGRGRDNSLTGAPNNDFADQLTPDTSRRPGADSLQHWFNPAAFTVNAIGTFGNVGRNALIGPGFFNLDFGLVKLTRITEEMGVQFRFEAFNILNHPNFNNPVGTVTNVNFGRITSAQDPRVLQFALRLQF